jgi:hypothetical protein
VFHGLGAGHSAGRSGGAAIEVERHGRGDW